MSNATWPVVSKVVTGIADGFCGRGFGFSSKTCGTGTYSSILEVHSLLQEFRARGGRRWTYVRTCVFFTEDVSLAGARMCSMSECATAALLLSKILCLLDRRDLSRWASQIPHLLPSILPNRAHRPVGGLTESQVSTVHKQPCFLLSFSIPF